MAKGSRLREYQTSILARLEDAKKPGAAAQAGYLGVVIGSKNVLVNLLEISETLAILHIHRVPVVKPWFLGVANVRGVLYAINDLVLRQAGGGAAQGATRQARCRARGPRAPLALHEVPQVRRPAR